MTSIHSPLQILVRRYLNTQLVEFVGSIFELLQPKILLLDSIISAVFGFYLYFAPEVVGDDIFQRKTDGVHWHLLRCLGGQLLSTAYLNFRLRNSSDASRSVCYLIRLATSVIMMMLAWQSWSQTPTLVNPILLVFVFVFSVAVFLTYGSFLLWNGWPVGAHFVPENGVSNFLFQLDSISYVCIGLAWLTFPKWLLHRQVSFTLDESHEFVGRLMGTCFIATFCNGQHAMHWSSERDQRVVVQSRLVCCIGILLAQIWSQIAYLEDWSGNHWVGITLFSTWTLVAGTHYLSLPSRYSAKDDKDL